MVNHGVSYMILTMVRTSLTMVIDGPFQFQEKLQYETWNLSLLDELNL